MKYFAAFLVLAIPQLAVAQGPSSDDVSVPGGALMLGSYLLLWALMLGYLAYLAHRQSVIEDDLEALQRRIDDALGIHD